MPDLANTIWPNRPAAQKPEPVAAQLPALRRRSVRAAINRMLIATGLKKSA